MATVSQGEGGREKKGGERASQWQLAMSDRLGQLAARLHDAQAQRDDLRLQQEVNHVRIIHLRRCGRVQ